ncbi:MAG: Response regulator containing a CheY-like receiver domain and an DNA-binding domain, partial [Actinomycetia bacterium]|nr:Response regulator containing a CheY-like receiver domain and an DNA-binding domain [Actinomycetes bacterium]
RTLRSGDGAAVDYGISVRVVARSGDRGEALIIVTPVGELSVTPSPLSPAERVIELEERMRRIAREVQAAGMITELGRLPGPETVPGLEDLSTRQWEVVTRLFRGDRVPAIARAMYLSPSTVRNHLATIFRKVGVHSQTELLDLLRQQA